MAATDGEWFSTAVSRKRFREKNGPELAKKKKKRKLVESDDELANELWADSKNSLDSVAQLSKSLKGYMFAKEPEDVKPKAEEKEVPFVDLYAESAEIQKIVKDYSLVKIPTKEELSEIRKIRTKRAENIKYDEVVRTKKTRENMPAHQCEMCQKFYDALDDDIVDKSALIISCSRHRYNYSPPPTPPGYWDLDGFDESGPEQTETKQAKPKPEIYVID